MPKSLIKGEKNFILEVKGDSMIDAGINDKDLVILAGSPKNGGGPAYRYASDDLQKDPDVIAATKKGNLDDDLDEDSGIYL